jgi:ubiquinone biosynthesis protein UbiJ
MEYGDAINARAAARAFEIACQKIAHGARDLRRVAAEAVAEAYCVCVVAGEDEVEGRLSEIHANLIDNLKVRLCAAAREQN